MTNQEMVAGLIDAMGGQQRLADAVGVSQGTVSHWLEDANFSTQAITGLKRLWSDWIVWRTWLIPFLLEQSTGSMVPQKFSLVRERHRLIRGSMEFIDREHITVHKKNRAGDFTTLVAKYLGASMFVSGSFVVFYKEAPDGFGILFDVIYVDRPDVRSAMGSGDPILNGIAAAV